MRSVCFLTTSLSLGGGAETQVARVSGALQDRGWRVEIVTLTAADAHPEETRVPVHELVIRASPASFARIVNHLRKSRPDVLVCFMFHANVIGRLAGRLAGVPVIVGSIRNERFGARWRERAERWTEPLGHAVTCNSAVVAARLVERGIVSASRLEVIPNACDVPDPRPSGEREQLRADLAPNGEFLWLSVGTLIPQKDRVGLVRAFARAFGERPDVRLVIAGGGPEREAAQREASDLGVDTRVDLLGVRDDVPALLGAADGFVLSSLWEGSPNALIEAALSGLPIVSTETGGVRELIEPDVSGVLVPPGDVEALADAMRRVTDLPLEERRRLGDVVRTDLSGRLGVEGIVDRWQALLSRLIDAR